MVDLPPLVRTAVIFFTLCLYLQNLGQTRGLPRAEATMSASGEVNIVTLGMLIEEKKSFLIN